MPLSHKIRNSVDRAFGVIAKAITAAYQQPSCATGEQVGGQHCTLSPHIQEHYRGDGVACNHGGGWHRSLPDTA